MDRIPGLRPSLPLTSTFDFELHELESSFKRTSDERVWELSRVEAEYRQRLSTIREKIKSVAADRNLAIARGEVEGEFICTSGPFLRCNRPFPPEFHDRTARKILETGCGTVTCEMEYHSN